MLGAAFYEVLYCHVRTVLQIITGSVGFHGTCAHHAGGSARPQLYQHLPGADWGVPRHAGRRIL